MNPPTHYDFMNLGALHGWPIKRILSEEETVNSIDNEENIPIYNPNLENRKKIPILFLNLPRTEAEQHIVKKLSDDQRKQLRKAGQVEIEAKDTDAPSNNNNTMKIYKLSLLLNSRRDYIDSITGGLLLKIENLQKEQKLACIGVMGSCISLCYQIINCTLKDVFFF